MAETKLFELKIRCTVDKTVLAEGPDEETVVKDPWGYAYEEYETATSDWEVLSIEEDK